jgi:hypothetical protein
VTEEVVSLRRTLAWGAIAFGVALAVIIGVRLEKAALTVVVGVTCGVGASIPTSLLIVALLQRRNQKRDERTRQLATQPPPVIVVTPQAAPQSRQPGTWPEEYTLPLPSQRRFSVIGEEETEEP